MEKHMKKLTSTTESTKIYWSALSSFCKSDEEKEIQNGSINTTRNDAGNMIQVSLLSDYPGFLQIQGIICVCVSFFPV